MSQGKESLNELLECAWRPDVKIMAAFKRWRSKYKRYKSQIPDQMRNRIILHYGLFKITWDWVILILVLYTAIEVPFVSAFVLDEERAQYKDNTTNSKSHLDFFQTLKQRYPESYPLLYTDLIIDILFMVDILMNFRTTYVKEGEILITSPWKIAVHYLKTYFLVDFVAAIPWDLLATFNSGTEENTMLFSLLKTARLLRLFRAARKLDRNYEYMTSLLFLMIMFFMLVAHWLACIWYAIGVKESRNDDIKQISWLGLMKENLLRDEREPAGKHLSLRTRYLASLYYVMTLCTTVGFGNISANTDGEMIFSIVCMLMGAVMHAAIFGNVTAIIHGQYSSNFRYRKESLQINEFVRYFKIKSPLARRLRDYSRHTWSQTKGTDMAKVLQKFPDGLQYEIHLHMHLTVLSDSFLFQDFEESCLRALAKKMHRHHHLPGHQILHDGDDIDSVHLVRRGRIDILLNSEQLGKIREGDAYGASLRQINCRPRSKVSLKASTCVDCHVITLKDLEDVMVSYRERQRQLLGMMDAANRKDVYEKGISNRNFYDSNKNGEERMPCFTQKKKRSIVEQEYELSDLKPMLGIPTSKLFETESIYADSKVGNGDVKKYSSSSMDNTLNDVAGRFINVTLSDISSADDNETAIKPFGDDISEDDVCEGDFSEEAPHHKLSIRKHSCFDCKTNTQRCKCADLEIRIEEMSGNLRTLQTQMGNLISLLERNPRKELNDTQRDFRNVGNPNCTMTSV